MAVKTSDQYADEFRTALADVEAQIKPLERERDRLRSLLAAADGKLKLDGEAASTGTGTRKASVPIASAKNRVSHLVKQKPDQSGAFYRKELADIPGNTVDEALTALVGEKKVKRTGKQRGTRYASA
jgi:hypothetical protein